MGHVSEFPNAVREILHGEIPMPDGCRLAARIWMPEGAEDAPVPAILEYLPYRKNDLTARRDASMQPWLAGHGYAVIRLDLRGAGDSEGLMKDEYLPQELQDGADAIAWIAAQPWCDGNVGMIGISWGGFNGLQIAALQPPALKTIITLCSTDDRYADDIHYMGGCLLGEHPSWASIMFARNSLPPDPANVGKKWRAMWQERLEGSGLWLKNWLEHQTRDEFWKHGSVCEDWSRIRIPVYAVSGWADGYCRTVFRLMENLQGPKKGLIGPWAHMYPHIGEPGPAIGFLTEELRWWDHWLKGRETGVMEEPQLRFWMQESAAPKGWRKERPGRWITEPSWPSPHIERQRFHLHPGGRLEQKEFLGDEVATHCSAGDVGMAAGRWCGYSTAGDGPLDQRRDDAGSLCFEMEILEEGLEFLGDARLHLRVATDRPVAQLAARLVDVNPENGEATRVSFGVLNLTHRESHESPSPLEPGRIYDVTIPMKHVAHAFTPGRRMRVALSTGYFPMIWPVPEAVTLSLHHQGSFLELPLRAERPSDITPAEFGEAERLPPLEVERLEEGENCFRITEDAATGAVSMEMAEGEGLVRIRNVDLLLREQGYETFTISPDDPGAATARFEWRYGMSRGDWAVSTLTETSFTATPDAFLIEARLRAWEGEEPVTDQKWQESIPRNLV